MKKIGKFTSRLLSLTLAAVMSLFAGISAYAQPAYQWGVDFSASDPEDCYGWRGDGSTKFFTDDTVHTSGSAYSIMLENTNYDTGCVEKTYDVEPYTTYRFSAMVKYSGYQPFPYSKEESGACIGEAYYYDPYKDVYMVPYGRSDFTVSSDWTLLEYEFTTGNETAHGLRLQNGDCKGKAWFSDIRLEKAETTNSWNILAVFFRNADANVVLNGKRVRYRMSLTESNIYEMNKYALDNLPANLKALSDGRLTVNSIDRYYSDEVLTEKDLMKYEDGYCVDEQKSTVLSKTLDKYLVRKKYHQVIIFVPFVGEDGTALTGDWWGLGGTSYKGVYFAQITNSWDRAFEIGDKFQGQVAVHEMCHCLENASEDVNPNKTPNFHSTLYDYPDPDVSAYERIHMFMTATLPGGKGLDPSVFSVPNGSYSLVSDDMTTGAGIVPISSAAAPPAPKNFSVRSLLGDQLLIGWDAVPNAAGYQFAVFQNGDFKDIRKTYDCESTSTGLYFGPIAKGAHCFYGVRTVYTVNGTDYYSDWTYLTYTRPGAAVVFGDVDNNGKFNILDISALLRICVNDLPMDQRTLEAVGAADKGRVTILDIRNLLTILVNS